MACSVVKKPSMIETPEIKLASIWINKKNQIQIENQLEIKFTKGEKGNFEYEKGMTKILATFSEANGNLNKLLYVSYELNPIELQKTIPCNWQEHTNVKFSGKTQVEIKEFVCNEKNILVKNNQQSYSLWEVWFGF